MVRFSSPIRGGNVELQRHQLSPSKRPFALIIALCIAAVSTKAAPWPVFPEEGTGWEISYSTIAQEDFSTPIRTIGPMGEIGEIGTLETKTPLRGQASLFGSSSGARGYQHYFNTRSDVLPLRGGSTYRLTFSYKVLETGDKGFEVMFYSPKGGDAGRWLEGITPQGPAGTSGVAELERKLYDFADYRVWLNVIGRGAIVVDDIRLSEGGRTIFAEDFEAVLPGPGPGVRIFGTGGVNAEGRLLFEKGTRLETDPVVIVLPRMTTFRLSFEYSFITPPANAIALDLQLLPVPGAKSSVQLRPLLGNGASSGRFSTGFSTGSVGPYVVSINAWNQARVLIDDFLIERGEARSFATEPDSYAYLEDAPFPRLGSYIMFSATEQVAWGGFEEVAWRTSVDDIERRLALFDIIAGFGTRPSGFDPDLPGRIKRLNPNAVLLPYVIGQEIHNVSHEASSSNPDPDGDPGIRYDRGLAPEWFVKTAKGELVNDFGYPGLYKLDIAPGAARIAGKDFLEYQIEGYRRLYFNSGIWDGIFIDNLFAKMNGHIPNAWAPEKLDYDINRNGRRDETPAMLNRISFDAERKLLEGLVSGTGNRELIMGNNGSLPETRLAPYVNGYLFEGFPVAWEGVGPESLDPSEPGWRRALEDYRIMDERCRSPRINLIEGFGRTESLEILNRGRAEANQEDFRRNRFILGTALLGDAFYEYDLTEARSSLSWFDEFAVEPDGVARESAAGKGYLGKALSSALELAYPARMIWEEGFEGSKAQATGGGSRLSNNKDEVIAGERGVVIEGKVRRSDAWPAYETQGAQLKLKKGKTYLLEFSWKVLEDLDYGLWFSIRSEKDEGGAQLVALFAGEAGRGHYPFTPREDGHYSLRFAILSAGKVAIDDLKVSEGGVGPWRRDFENGFVLVNPYRSPASFDVATLKGALGRSGIRRIKGGQAPEVNTGEPVTRSLELGPFDAIILLADHREAR